MLKSHEEQVARDLGGREFRVEGLGFRAWGLGFRVWVLGFGVYGLGRCLNIWDPSTPECS